MKLWRWVVLAVAAVLFLAAITGGPLLAGIEAKNGTNAALRAAETSQAAAHNSKLAADISAGIRQLLDRVAQIQQDNRTAVAEQTSKDKTQIATLQKELNQAVAAIITLAKKCQAAPPCSPGQITIGG